MNRAELSQISYDCVLPSAIFFNEKIEPAAIKTYAIVRNLTKMSGYCFATNDYLSETLAIESRTVKRHLSSLKSQGFIEIKTEKNGIHWQRKIYISERFKKIFTKGQKCPGGGTKMSPIKEEYSIKYSSSCAAPPQKGGSASPPRDNSTEPIPELVKPASPESLELAGLFKTRLLEVNPHASTNELEDARVFDSMPALNQASIGKKEICAAINYVFDSLYWMDKIVSAKLFAKKFTLIFSQIVSKRSKEAFSKIKKQNVSLAKKIVKELRDLERDLNVAESEKSEAQSLLIRMEVQDACVKDHESGEEIKLSLEPSEFKRRLSKAFGFLLDEGL